MSKKNKNKPYFYNVKVDDKIFGLVYGEGKVINTYDKGDFYSFEVEYENSSSVHYTIEGYPNWGNFDEQTIFYQNDINIFDLDISPIKKILTIKQIIKLRSKNKLEIRNKSGIWRDFCKTPLDYREKMLEDKRFHLFRKKPN